MSKSADLSSSDAIILFLIMAVLFACAAGLEIHYEKAFTLSRYDSSIVEKGTSAYEWAVGIKIFIAFLSSSCFVIKLISIRKS